MWIRKRINYEIFIKRNMKRQLSFRNAIPTIQKTHSKRVLVPLIETSHYQYGQVLILAKALEMRGADVQVLLCGSFLDGCEIKNSRKKSKDPCLNCRFSARIVVIGSLTVLLFRK